MQPENFLVSSADRPFVITLHYHYTRPETLFQVVLITASHVDNTSESILSAWMDSVGFTEFIIGRFISAWNSLVMLDEPNLWLWLWKTAPPPNLTNQIHHQCDNWSIDQLMVIDLCRTTKRINSIHKFGKLWYIDYRLRDRSRGFTRWLAIWFMATVTASSFDPCQGCSHTRLAASSSSLCWHNLFPLQAVLH